MYASTIEAAAKDLARQCKGSTEFAGVVIGLSGNVRTLMLYVTANLNTWKLNWQGWFEGYPIIVRLSDVK